MKFIPVMSDGLFIRNFLLFHNEMRSTTRVYYHTSVVNLADISERQVTQFY